MSKDTKFTSDNQPEPESKKRGKAKKTLMLDAIREHCGSEDEFLKGVVKAAVGTPKDPSDPDSVEIPPNHNLLTLVLNRIEPPLKATSPMVEFKFTKGAKPHEQAIEVMVAASQGIIPPDIANLFVSSIASMLKIKEITDIEERLSAMEKVNEQD